MAEMRWVGAAGASNMALSFPLVPRGVGSAGLRLRRLTILFITMLAGLCNIQGTLEIGVQLPDAVQQSVGAIWCQRHLKTSSIPLLVPHTVTGRKSGNVIFLIGRDCSV